MLQSSVALPAVAASTRATGHRCIVRCFPSLLQAATAPQQQRCSAAATRAKAASQRLLQQCRSACCNSAATTRAATSPQRSRDTCCNIAAALPRRELQHYNATSLQCCSVASLQCCSNASLHRCSSTLPLPSPQSSRASCGMVTSDVALPIFVRWTSVPGLPFVGPTSVGPTSCLSCSPTPYRPVVLRPASFTTTPGTFQIVRCVRIL